MKPFALIKGSSRIEVSQANGLINFATVRAGKNILSEYVIEKDYEMFIRFLKKCGYESNEAIK